ncbi:hypothetical protein D9615_008421 [Tricholomella constricta]|uniref:Major facilitator superfamily (MFS) profile domain-containing protein n=1 Tax=Tricholomella constricta TaxID=117010 RepID=A0A8H5M5F9_9AGAR|nr:hypothetical protein D9615_008421 [Tricholomella constricta]
MMCLRAAAVVWLNPLAADHRVTPFHETHILRPLRSPTSSTAHYPQGLVAEDNDSSDNYELRRRWSFHYLVSASLAVLNTLALVLVFRFKHLDELLAESGQASPDSTNASPPHARENTYRQLFRLKAVHILTILAVIYIGIEVTVGGWIVTFIIRERGGGHSAGYIASGFFDGLMLGRIGLMWLNKLVGSHLVVIIYSIIAIILEIMIWFVPSIIGNAVAVSLIGLVLGPMFPVMLSHSSKVLPRWLLTVCIGWITGIGMVGSAALPFLTGLLSSRYGIASLQPLYITKYPMHMAFNALTLMVIIVIVFAKCVGAKPFSERKHPGPRDLLQTNSSKRRGRRAPPVEEIIIHAHPHFFC